MNAVEPASFGAWLLAARPRTLAAAIGPVAVGTASAYAAGATAILPALAALTAAVLIQVGTNFVNDAADFSRGTDNENRLGPTRAAQAGLLSTGALWRGAAISFIASAAIGVYLIAQGGWPIAVVGVVSILAGIAYTAGPVPLAYLGVADLAVFVFFGFVAVCGTALVQMGSIPTSAVWASVPVGTLSTAMLAINNLRDRAGDRLTNKKTFAVRFGRKAAVVQSSLLIVVAFAVPLAAAGLLAAPTLLLPLVSFPLAIAPLRAVLGGREGAELSTALAQTARLLLVYSLLLAGGIALW